MAANPKSPLVPVSGMERYHEYHAEAHVLSGALKHPVEQPIQHQARVVLEHTRDDSHIAQSVKETNLEGLISFKAGHSRASGSKSARAIPSRTRSSPARSRNRARTRSGCW